MTHFWTCPHYFLGNAGVFNSLDDQIMCIDSSGYMELGLITEHHLLRKCSLAYPSTHQGC